MDTVIHCGDTLPVVEAVVIADSALRNKMVKRKALVAAVKARRRTPGVGKLKRMLAWSDGKSGSVLESAFRVVLSQVRACLEGWMSAA